MICSLVELTGWDLQYIYELEYNTFLWMLQGFVELNKSKQSNTIKPGQKEVSPEEFIKNL